MSDKCSVASTWAAVVCLGIGACAGPVAPAPVADAAAAGAGCGPLDDTLRVNQIQAKGTHNSYHIARPEPLAQTLAYTHAALDEQLDDQGVRHFELDIHWDAGGFRVFHIPALDQLSHCDRLRDCLKSLRKWSDAHPCHHLLWVVFELKDDLDGEDKKIAGHFDQLEAEIGESWPRERVFMPDDLRGAAADLPSAVTGTGWPTLGATRGKIGFAMMDHPEAVADYLNGHPVLQNRLIFVVGDPGQPYVALVKRDDPDPSIAKLVAEGYLVRVRADAVPGEPDKADPVRRDAALASGAQLVSTDFAVPVGAYPYFVDLPGGTPSRCNPVNAPAGCTSEAVEKL